MLEVGVDSFVSLEDANDYVRKHFTTNDEYRVRWESLTDEDKEAWLRRSTIALNSLKYVGRKKGPQLLEFPRVNSIGVYGTLPVLFRSQYYDNGLISANGPYGDADGMLAISRATVENALAGNVLNETVQSSKVANIQGLTSMKAGNVSKTYNRNSKGTRDSNKDIYTDRVYAILVDWLQSGRYTF